MRILRYSNSAAEMGLGRKRHVVKKSMGAETRPIPPKTQKKNPPKSASTAMKYKTNESWKSCIPVALLKLHSGHVFAGALDAGTREEFWKIMGISATEKKK